MTKARARDLGIPLEGLPGPWNAITDVTGVSVGFATLIEGNSARTGVTILHPRGQRDHEPVFAGTFAFNGNGEMTGAAWVEEGGMLEGPIGLTNTHSVGVVRDAIIEWQAEHDSFFQRWSCPLVAETADGLLNDMNRFHVQPGHVRAALDSAQAGPVAEGNVGGGTGMICYEFKGGTGTASRRLPPELGGWTVGALVQANFGRRDQLTVAGIPVGQYLKEGALFPQVYPPPPEQGSLIVILATDAPLLPHQLKRIARRATLGMARTGSLGGNGSGDIFLAFSTSGTGTPSNDKKDILQLQALPNEKLDPLFFASVYATEEAILNAMLAAETMTGRDGVTVRSPPACKTAGGPETAQSAPGLHLLRTVERVPVKFRDSSKKLLSYQHRLGVFAVQMTDAPADVHEDCPDQEAGQDHDGESPDRQKILPAADREHALIKNGLKEGQRHEAEREGKGNDDQCEVDDPQELLQNHVEHRQPGMPVGEQHLKPIQPASCSAR